MNTNNIGYFSSRWHGKAPLWKVFWLDYTLATCLIALALYCGAIVVTTTVAIRALWNIQFLWLCLGVISIIYLAMYSVASIMVWRCAPNTTR